MEEEELKLLKENNILLKEVHAMLSKLMDPEFQREELMKAMCVNLAANLLIKR